MSTMTSRDPPGQAGDVLRPGQEAHRRVDAAQGSLAETEQLAWARLGG